VHELVSDLADPLRSVLLLYLLGFTPSRIAESLELDQAQVKCLISSGVELLIARIRQRG
jgi:DNA-directed RNA polymerase specialized sigma24 family protein